MSIYDDHFGVQFGYKAAGDKKEYHSFRYFDLYPRRKPIIAPPKPKRLTVEVPGSNGVLDYSTALTGYMQYENREGTFEYTYIGRREDFDWIYHRILSRLHGKKMAVVIDEDKSGFYYGYLEVQEPEYAKDRMYITIKGDLEPFKYELITSTEPWLWDPFSFKTGVIRDYSAITFSNNLTNPSFDRDGDDAITLLGSPMPLVPHIFLESGTGVKIGYKASGRNRTVTLQSGDATFDQSVLTPDLILRDGENTIWLAGSGRVRIEYRGGVL